MKKIQAIDFMYYVATREFMEQWDRAKEGELVCRMEKAIGGPPRFASIDEMLRQMDDAGVEKAFITQCKMWSYWRKWMYMDTKLEDSHGHHARRSRAAIAGTDAAGETHNGVHGLC